jgi:hypothetical protein
LSAVELALLPRVNADDSLTVSVEATSLSGAALPGAESLSDLQGTTRNTESTQVRVAAGETILLDGLVPPPDAETEKWLAANPQIGTRLLTQPLVSITPRVIAPPVIQLPLTGQSFPAEVRGGNNGEVWAKLLNTVFQKAFEKHCFGFMVGLDTEGKTVIWMQVALNQWEEAVLMPDYVCEPLVRAINGLAPHDAETVTLRTEEGQEVPVSVLRQPLNGQPSIVLTGSRPW